MVTCKTATCLECGDKFNKTGANHKYCPDCRKAFSTCINCGAYRGPKRSHYGLCRSCYIELSSSRVIVNCQRCGKDMTVHKSRIKQGYGKYCSDDCKYAAMSDNMFSGKEKNCLVCGKVFRTKQSRAETASYCSSKCRGIDQQDRQKFVCQKCGKIFYLRPCEISKGRGTFCSRECQISSYDRESNPNWRGGIAPWVKRKALQANLPATLTEEQWGWLLEYFENRCAYCGRSADDVGTLAREHVIPVAQMGGYTVDNIVPACTHCNSTKHARTPQEAGLEFWKDRPVWGNP